MKKKVIRLTESDLRNIIANSVKRIIKETRLDYDEDNFSGRWTKNPTEEDYIDPEGYLDDPYHAPNSWDDDEWIDGDENMEKEYSWHKFDDKAIAPSVDGYSLSTRRAIPREKDDAVRLRRRQTEWTPGEERQGRIARKNWVHNNAPEEELEDWKY